MKFLALSAIALFMVTGCTNKGMYHAMQKNAINECKRQPQADPVECEREYSKTYEQYKDASEDKYK